MGGLTSVVRRHGDAILAALLVGAVLVQVWATDRIAHDRVLATVLVLLVAIPLALRSRHPLVLLGALLALGQSELVMTDSLLDVEAFGPVTLVAIYSAAAHTRGRAALAAGALTATFAVGAAIGDPGRVGLDDAFWFGLLFGAPWAAGRIVRRRATREAMLERERDAAEAAIREERARIALELHDVVAHAISVMVLQATGARRLIEVDPDEARTALHTIEATGRQAIVEMRRMVGLLREVDAGPGPGSPPSVLALDDLLGRVRAAGLPVEVVVEGAPDALPPSVDLSAYRIVQEALTNALRHAGPARATVLLRFGGDALEIEVRDDGRAGGTPTRAGYGLAGIRERAEVFGGSAHAGPVAAGGFAVHASLPYGGTA